MCGNTAVSGSRSGCAPRCTARADFAAATQRSTAPENHVETPGGCRRGAPPRAAGNAVSFGRRAWRTHGGRRVDQEPGQRYRAAFVRLGRTDLDPAPDGNGVAAHMDSAAQYVDVGHMQPGQLAPPQPAVGEHAGR